MTEVQPIADVSEQRVNNKNKEIKTFLSVNQAYIKYYTAKNASNKHQNKPHI